MTDTSFVAVVGMHRSGTSMVTRLLNLLGVGLGPDSDLMEPHASDNPTGYWEHVPMVEINDGLLAELGGSWDSPPTLGDGWIDDPRISAYRERATEVLQQLGSETSIGGCKDPRLSLLLPFWQTAGAIDATVLVVRHPFQVAASLLRRDAMPPEQAADLWTRYTVSAWRSHRRRIVVDYESVLADPIRAAASLATFLGVPLPTDWAQIRDFVDPSLRHHADATPGEVGPNMILALSMHALLESQADTLVDRVFDAVHDEWVEANEERVAA